MSPCVSHWCAASPPTPSRSLCPPFDGLSRGRHVGVCRWGEPVFQFWYCLGTHESDHKAWDADQNGDPPCVYWVCAYANNQWKLGEELVDDLEQTSFRKALNAAEGTVTVLDSGSMSFTRVWCCYEVFVSLKEAADTLCAK